MKRLLCIWLPDWPIQRRRSRPLTAAPANQTATLDHPPASPADTPIVLWRADPRRGRIVVARCRQSVSCGVRLGMSIAQATDLLRHASTAVGPIAAAPIIEEHDRRADLAAIGQLATVVQQELCPKVCPERLDRFIWSGRTLHLPESLICDLQGITHLFGGETGLIQAARRLLARWDLQPRIAIADSVGAAWAIANHGQFSGSHQIVLPGMTVDALRAVCVQGLRIAPETVHTLGRLGVETIGHVLKLPRSGLAPRLGKHLVTRIAQVLGEVDEPVSRIDLPDVDSATMALEYPTDDWPILSDRIGRLLEKVRAGLATRERGALRVTCCLDLTAHPPLTLEIGLFAPTLDAGHWHRLIENAVHASRLPSDAHRVSVSVPLSAPLRTTQASLLDDHQNAWSVGGQFGGSQLARLVDGLSGRLGQEQVRGIRITADPLPENACQSFPLAGRSTGGNSTKKQSARQRNVDQLSSVFPNKNGVLRRPLKLLSKPANLFVQPDCNRSKDSSYSLPSRFRLGGQVYQIVRNWGPERIETDWWDGPCVRRDYFRVETHTGQWWWIFLDLTAKAYSQESESWMLHGKFQ